MRVLERLFTCLAFGLGGLGVGLWVSEWVGDEQQPGPAMSVGAVCLLVSWVAALLAIREKCRAETRECFNAGWEAGYNQAKWRSGGSDAP